MSLRRTASRIAALAAISASAILLLGAASAAAAPQLGVQLRSDANEVQMLTVDATGGDFVLSFGAGGPGVSETTEIPATATAAQVQAALNAIDNISAGGGSVTVSGGPGDAGGTHPYEVYFGAGPLVATNLAQLTAASGSTPLTGGASTVSVATTHDGFPVYHSDERVDFTAKVKNLAPKTESLSPGDELTCDPHSSKWHSGSEPNEPTSFSFKWLSSGVQVGTGATYEVQAADAGHTLQCLVMGENAGGASVAATLPLAVAPAPSPQPPAYAGSGQPRPLTTETPAPAGGEITCTAPTTWTGSPSWTFEWLLDGGPPNGTITATTATTSTYEVAGADVPGALQCVAIAKTGSGEAPTGGTVVTISPATSTSPEPSPFPPFNEAHGSEPGADLPFIVDPNTTSGPITLELELPGGEGTFAFQTEGFGWTCESIPASGAQYARVLCSREDAIFPQNEFPPLKVITALGADAPDIGTAKATAFGGGAGTVSDQLSFPIQPAIPFGLSLFTAALLDESENDYTQAGGHPFQGLSDVVFNQKRVLVPSPPLTNNRAVEHVKQVIVDLPRGVVGNPLALPALCPGTEEVRETPEKPNACPSGSVVGGIRILTRGIGITTRIFAIEPEFGTPAQFAFTDGQQDVFTFTPSLRSGDGYALSLEVAPAPEVGILESTVTFCDFGVEKLTLATFCKKKDDPTANPKPLFTQPTRCGVPLTTRVRLNSWETPTFIEGPPFANATIEGCQKVPFEPTMQVTPTTALADSPTGLEVELTMPTEGLEKADECHQTQGDQSSPLATECLSESNLREAKVTLPQGLTVSPAGANGLEACSEAQVGISPSGVPNDAPADCPNASRIGSAEVRTPLLKKPLDGAVYQAEQDRNPFGSTLAIYLVAELPERGIRLKLAGKVELDPQTGQLTSTFADTPQQPFKSFKLEFFGGATAPLRTPEVCGEYSTTSVLTPWSAPESGPLTETSPYSVTQSPGGGECPTSEAAQPNSPEFDAGTVTPIAGAYSPLVIHLSRSDGSQRFASLSLTPPPGLLAKLAGTATCSEAALAAAEDKTGKEEQASPSCPAASHLGTAHVATGAGPAPYWAKGEVYLTGPYQGAPLSLAIVTPAVAGPFDLGTVVVRTALHLDPRTAQITALSDPIPQILEGIPLDLRTVAVDLDKPSFTRNGTSCDPLAFTGQLLSPLGQAAPLSERFQLAECGRLGFKPRISLRLLGGTHRADNQGLRAVVQGREGDANIARTAVTLPHAAFLAQNHIRTVCTRVQFAADQCPAGSVYGRATATTPLLDYPLSGPVYLRSSDNPLPDLVVKLKGPDTQPIEIDLAGRTDSVRGALRNTFDLVPDAPVSSFTLELFGGKRGLIELSTDDYCAAKHRATINLGAQNGLRRTLYPLVRNPSCAKQQRKGRHRGAPRRSG